MHRRISAAVLIFFFVFTGGHLPFVQVAALFSMIKTHAAHDTLLQAIKEAFGADDHCHLCTFVRESSFGCGCSLARASGNPFVSHVCAVARPVRFRFAPVSIGMTGHGFFFRCRAEEPPTPPPKFLS